MLKIFLFADWYEPGYKAGGPIRSCVNFTAHMQETREIYVFTTDRDLGATEPYPGIPADQWIRVGQAQVYYASPAALGWSNIKKQLRDVAPDLIYLNSMYSVRFTIFPLLIGRLAGMKHKIVLSPRGMLRASAVRFKPARKKNFLRVFRWLGFHKQVHFLASDDTELDDVRRYFGQEVRVTVLPNFPAALPEAPAILGKVPGELSMIFIGRIHPIKNLDYLLRLLPDISAGIRLTIVGSLEDEDYWSACQRLIKALPHHITVWYAGEMPNNELPPLIAKHHILTLPTSGENFGHAIFEAMAAGKPVLISDQTPWRSLGMAGWDLPLDNPGLFKDAIREAASLDQKAYDERCRAVYAHVKDYIERLDLKAEYKKLFS